MSLISEWTLECPSAADTSTTQVLIPVPSDAQEHTYWYMLIPGDFMVFSMTCGVLRRPYFFYTLIYAGEYVFVRWRIKIDYDRGS